MATSALTFDVDSILAAAGTTAAGLADKTMQSKLLGLISEKLTSAGVSTGPLVDEVAALRTKVDGELAAAAAAEQEAVRRAAAAAALAARAGGGSVDGSGGQAGAAEVAGGGANLAAAAQPGAAEAAAGGGADVSGAAAGGAGNLAGQAALAGGALAGIPNPLGPITTVGGARRSRRRNRSKQSS
jgi:hypothetical protein